MREASGTVPSTTHQNGGASQRGLETGVLLFVVEFGPAGFTDLRDSPQGYVFCTMCLAAEWFMTTSYVPGCTCSYSTATRAAASVNWGHSN